MGSILALLSAALFAVAAVLVRRGMQGSTAITATLISVLTNLVTLWALAVGTGGIGLITTPAALTLLPPGVAHDGRPAITGSGYRKQVLYLQNAWLPDDLTGRIAHRPTLSDPVSSTAARRVHSALAHPGDEMAAEHWLLVVRDAVYRHAETARPAPRDVPLARRLRDVLDDRFAESFTIAEIARQLGAHPSHLVRVFSQTYGIAPHRYLVGRRVDAARRLLVDGCRPADAAARTGFHDQAHLTRHFRRVWGATPGAFAAGR